MPGTNQKHDFSVRSRQILVYVTGITDALINQN